MKVMIAVAGAMMAACLTAEPVKPVNGVGQGPLIGWIDTKLFAYLGEAGVRQACRLRGSMLSYNMRREPVSVIG